MIYAVNKNERGCEAREGTVGKSKLSREGLSEEVMFDQGFGSSERAGNGNSMHIVVNGMESSQAESKTYHWPSPSSLTWDKLPNHSVLHIPICKMGIISLPIVSL